MSMRYRCQKCGEWKDGHPEWVGELALCWGCAGKMRAASTSLGEEIRSKLMDLQVSAGLDDDEAKRREEGMIPYYTGKMLEKEKNWKPRFKTRCSRCGVELKDTRDFSETRMECCSNCEGYSDMTPPETQEKMKDWEEELRKRFER